ncbi:MAG: nucleotidyltransferase family protein [Armatimonadetes bacterium]|nr:nucleotidyltransferase family protein [Armatimonadota bacterium]
MLKDPAQWGAVILAGGREVGDLAAAMGTPLKALAQFAGRPSVSFVLEACRSAGVVRIAVAGDPDVHRALDLTGENEMEAEAGTTNLRTARNGVEALNRDGPLLILPCDSPLLTGEHLAHFIESVAKRLGPEPPDKWFAVGLARREEVEREMPGAPNRIIRLQEGQFASGALYAASRAGFETAFVFLEGAGRDRKSQFRLLMRIGLWNALRYVAGRTSLQDAERAGRRILGGRTVVIPDCHPFTTMDFDAVEGWSYLSRWFGSQE